MAPTAGGPRAVGWRQLLPSGALPPARRDHSLVTDGDRLYLFAGRMPQSLSDLWIYDIAGGNWTEVTAPGPAPRFGHNAVWDPDGGRMVVFGGQDGSTFYNDLWAFDAAAGQWQELPAPAGPSPRYGAGGAFDPTGRLLVTHGFTTEGRFDDTWAYGLAQGAWTDISPELSERPIERCLMRAVWDPQQERLFIFGGQTTGTAYLGDFWSLSAQGWRQLTRDPAPSARNLYSMVFDNEQFGALVFGGDTKAGPVNDFWFFDAGSERWNQPEVEGDLPPARLAHDAAWVAAASTLYVFGGSDGSANLDDLWAIAPA